MPKLCTKTVAMAALSAMGAVVVFGSTTPSGGAAAGSPRVSASTPLGDPAPAQGRDLPGLATDPADPRHVVEIDEDFLRGQCTFRTTFDGGTTWTGGDLTVAGPSGENALGDDPVVRDDPAAADPALPAPTRPPCDSSDSGGFAHFSQSVAFGSGQNTYTTFSVDSSVVVARSPDGGKSWDPATVAIGAPPDTRPFDVRPRLAVAADPGGDRIYLAAAGAGGDDGQGRRRLVATRSDDGGTTWTPVVDVEGETDNVREPAQPAVAPDGTVYLAWRNGPGPGADEVVVAKSVDGARTWSRSRAGEARSPTSPEGSGQSDGGFPFVAVDGATGAVHLVYRGEHDGGTDISHTRSNDGGSTWSPPRPVSDDAPRADTRHFVPRMSIAAEGRLDVVWTDTRSSYRSPVAYGDVWYSSSADGGQTFTRNRRINDHSLRLGPGSVAQSFAAPVLTPLGDDRLLFAWGDSRNGGTGTGVDADAHATGDVYMATAELGATGAVPESAFPDTSPEQLSVDLSRLAFPGGAGKSGSQRTTRVVVVNATDDTGLALSAAVLARANESPLLLARSTDLTSEQKDEVARLAPGGAYLVGAASRLSDRVVASLADAGATDTQRIAGIDAADTARRIALMLDSRDAGARSRGEPAFDGAVIVNSQTGDAATGSALAAALRMPVLFAQRDGVPPATTEALDALAIETTLVVGGPESVGDEVLEGLPGGKRLGGADPTLTSEAVAVEARERNVPTNVVYVTDGERPIDQAALGATVARVGGLMLAEPNADADAARSSLDRLGLTAAVDRLVVVRSDTTGASSGLRLVLAALIFLLGVAIMLIALSHREKGPTEIAGSETGLSRSRVRGRSG